jgi:DNA-binding NarL/FixJ family response regulator
MSTTTRILIVDDHASVREGLRLLLSEEPALSIVGEAATGEEAVELAVSRVPDVILMDLMLPGISGIEAIRSIRAVDPRPQFVVLTSYASAELLQEALEAGAAAYLLKDVSLQTLLEAIAGAREGRRMVDIRESDADGSRESGVGS